MKRKLLILLSCVVLPIIVAVSFGIRNTKDKDLRVQEYFPSRKMTKEFSGGYEREGFSHIVKRVERGKVQIEQWDTGTGVVQVYQISENDIRLIYSETGESFKDNYIDNVDANRDDIILKAPLAAGTKWMSNSGGNYEITGVNVKVFTRIGMFYAVEVTHKRNEYESKSYFVKNVGLVKSSFKGNGSDNLIKLKYK